MRSWVQLIKKSEKRAGEGIGSRDDDGAEGGEGMDEGDDKVIVRRVVDVLDVKGKGGQGEGENER